MPALCSGCPFNKSGEGARNRQEVGRRHGWGRVTQLLRNSDAPPCHKHLSLVCAGAVEWQRLHGTVPDLTPCRMTFYDGDKVVEKFLIEGNR